MGQSALLFGAYVTKSERCEILLHQPYKLDIPSLTYRNDVCEILLQSLKRCEILFKRCEVLSKGVEFCPRNPAGGLRNFVTPPDKRK